MTNEKKHRKGQLKRILCAMEKGHSLKRDSPKREDPLGGELSKNSIT